MKLWDAPRSSASYRVRIALHWKGIEFERIPVDLVAGAQREPAYRATHPQGLVPALADGEVVLQQSLAIVEYLDEIHPQPPLLPRDPVLRARVRAAAQLVACDIHPLNNLRVLRYLEDPLDLPEETRLAWYRHWIAEGLGALERMLGTRREGPYCFGESVSLADLCLVPQLFNARRFACPTEAYPTLRRIDAACQRLPAFQAAHPERSS